MFVARHLPSSGLDSGAFRIHLSPEHLEQARLTLGDFCLISNEGGDALGYGIAWRATDKMGASTKTRPVKMTDTLRAAYNIKDGDLLSLARSDAQIVHADKVVLTDATPSDWYSNDVQDERWRTRSATLLCNCEAFATGISFELSAKKGVKRRFRIDRVDASETQQGPPNLYYFDDSTVIVLSDDATSTQGTCSLINVTIEEVLSEQYIGGLLKQIQDLNRKIQGALNSPLTARSTPGRAQPNRSILIHGFEGTGKSLVLEQLAQSKVCNTFRLRRDTLDASTTAKNKDIIKALFKSARAKQPSLVLMDQVNKIAPVGDDTYVYTINEELLGLAGSRVVVVAACRSTADLNEALFADRLISIELPVPDQQAREQILNVLVNSESDFDRAIAKAVSERTHGFTGRDLTRLITVAESNADDRFIEWKDGLSESDAPALTQDVHTVQTNGLTRQSLDSLLVEQQNGMEKVETLLNGNAHRSEEPDSSIQPLLLPDFELALSKVRPTALREIIFEPPKTTWADIGGSAELQKQLDRIILTPIQHKPKLAAYGKRAKKGVLLYGPPGCSKTLTAQAIATKYGLNFIAIKGSELISMYVGESERSVRELFRKARAAKPCVIFFDEVDSIASKRESDSSKGLNVLTTLLTEMDGFNDSEGVLVLAATNKPEALDEAILRPGRFDAHFYLGPPDLKARREILQIMAKGAPGGDSLDYENLAEATEGYTGAELYRIYDLASDLAIDRDIDGDVGAEQGKLSMDDFEYGIRHTPKRVSSALLARYETFRKNIAEQ